MYTNWCDLSDSLQVTNGLCRNWYLYQSFTIDHISMSFLDPSNVYIRILDEGEKMASPFKFWLIEFSMIFSTAIMIFSVLYALDPLKMWPSSLH